MHFEDTFVGRPNTVKTYISLFRNHIEPLNLDGVQFRRRDVQGILNQWQEKGLSRNTQMTLIRLLGRFVKFEGGKDINTAMHVRTLERSEQQREVTTLTSDEASRLMDNCRKLDPKFYPLMMLALHAGLRRGEIFGLKCRDIDLLKGQIKVSRSYDGPTKSGKSRIVPMSPELAKALTGARNLLLRGADENVFEKFDPNPLLRRICTRAGVVQLKFHDLRHTFASLGLSSGMNPKMMSTLLGHASVTTTLNIYWNLNSEQANLSFLPN